VDVSPNNAGTIKLENAPGTEYEVEEPTVYPTPASDPIVCFDVEMVWITANPKSGYRFDYWKFNYWPPEDLGPPKIYLDEATDKTLTPLAFLNTYLENDDNDGDGYTEVQGDCDDDNALINPDVSEPCVFDIKLGYGLHPRTITAHFSLSSAPPAPENVIATDGTETGKVIIAWDSSPGTDDYVIYRASSLQDDKTQLGQTTETAFEDTTVTGANIYYYWIEAVNDFDPSPYSAYNTGYAYVEDPPPPIYEPVAVTPAETKQMLDTDPDVIVIDVSTLSEYETNHIICAINGTVTIVDTLDADTYLMVSDYKDFPVLVYDQDGTDSKTAADYLAGNGFSEVYYMTGGLLEWISNGWETVDSDQLYECSLPPMALAGEDGEGDENARVTLDGSGSIAPDNDNLKYEWYQNDGTTADIESPSSEITDVTLPYVQEGGEKLIFYLKVTDSDGNKDTDSVAVDVVWHNSRPVADAGSFQSVPEGTPVTLDSESSDRDDGIVSYQWEQISGPDAEDLQNSTSETARFTAPNIDTDEAELLFKLTVTDKGGLSDTDQVIILVSKNNAPPVALAGPEQIVSETQQVQLDGSESKDTDDGIKTYSWTQIEGSPTVTLSSHSVASPTFTAPEIDEGSIILEFQLTVTDRSGATDTDQVTITVNDLGDPPIADAGTDKNPVYGGWQLTLDGTGSMDADGEILSYQWTQTSGPDVSLTGENSATPEFTVPKLEEESVQLVFQLTVTDDTGLNGSDQVKIVATKALVAPSADAGDDQEIKEGDIVLLNATGSSDPDDGIARYSWQQTGGEPTVELSDSAAVNPEFTAPNIDKATVLTFTLTATDYSGNEDTDEIEVRVLSNNGGGGGGSCFISTIR